MAAGFFTGTSASSLHDQRTWPRRRENLSHVSQGRLRAASSGQVPESLREDGWVGFVS
jgi:hypothetical protein